jgi:hypothetical protein
VPQHPRLTVIGTSDSPLTAGDDVAALRRRAEAADADVAVVLCADQRAFEPFAEMAVPALAWCMDGTRPHLGPRDRWISAGSAPGAWRHLPLPVPDELYSEPGPAGVRWLGPPSERRSEYLAHYPPPASAGGVAINLRDADPVRLEYRAAAALAAGLVLVSEPLEHRRGLERGLDYVEVEGLDEVFRAVEAATCRPHAFERMRVRGRAKAEAFRASALTGRAAADLLLELSVR